MPCNGGQIGLGFIWTLFRRRGFGLSLFGWVVLMFLTANLSVWGIPGGGYLNNLSVEIMLFIPISTLAGFGIADCVSTLRSRLGKSLRQSSEK